MDQGKGGFYGGAFPGAVFPDEPNAFSECKILCMTNLLQENLIAGFLSYK